jgi:hypothetical protein
VAKQQIPLDLAVAAAATTAAAAAAVAAAPKVMQVERAVGGGVVEGSVKGRSEFNLMVVEVRVLHL